MQSRLTQQPCEAIPTAVGMHTTTQQQCAAIPAAVGMHTTTQQQRAAIPAAVGMHTKKKRKKMFIQIKSNWYYNVYIHKLKLSINYSD